MPQHHVKIVYEKTVYSTDTTGIKIDGFQYRNIPKKMNRKSKTNETNVQRKSFRFKKFGADSKFAFQSFEKYGAEGM